MWNFEAENRPVIHLDMSQVADDTKDIVLQRLRNKVNRIASLSQLTIDPALDVCSFMEVLVEDLHRKSGKQVVVIIDEYDAQ
jgi:hypothetical protein